MAMTILFIALMLPGLALLLFVVARFAWHGAGKPAPGRPDDGRPTEPRDS